MPSAFRHRKIMPEVPHSIPDLFSEHVHELGRALFNFYSSDLAPNARPELLPEAGAERRLEAVSSRPMILIRAKPAPLARLHERGRSLTSASVTRGARGQSASRGQGAERGSRTSHWTSTGAAWSHGLSSSHGRRARLGAQRHVGPDPLAWAWTSAPPLALRRGARAGQVGCPAPAPGPHGRTRSVEPPLCLGRYAGPERWRGRSASPRHGSARALTLATAPQEVLGAAPGGPSLASDTKAEHVARDGRRQDQPCGKKYKIRS
jgi:hypothetical protein